MIIVITAFATVGIILLRRAIAVLEEEVDILDEELNKLEETLLDKGVVNINEVVTIKE
jgi:hypothetical protein